jgi:hypothetical protein
MNNSKIRILLAFVGIVIVITARLYHFIYQPQWTEVEAIRMLWIPYFCGFLISSLSLLEFNKGQQK